MATYTMSAAGNFQEKSMADSVWKRTLYRLVLKPKMLDAALNPYQMILEMPRQKGLLHCS